MSIVAARRYFSGRVEEAPVAIDGDLRVALPPGSFDWIGLAQPTPDEIGRVARQFGLHPLAVEDALNPNQSPKIEPYGAQLLSSRAPPRWRPTIRLLMVRPRSSLAATFWLPFARAAPVRMWTCATAWKPTPNG